MVKLSQEQQKATTQSLASNKQVYVICGAAGTGKTTFITSLVSQARGSGKYRNVYVVAFSGKAASVLKSKGIDIATTFHSVVYTCVGTVNGQKINSYQNEIRKLYEEYSVDIPKEVVNRINEINEAIAALIDNNAPVFARKEDVDDQDKKQHDLLGPEDLVIIDELSMISEEMACDLLDYGCKVIAVGDPHQLPPINGETYFVKEFGIDFHLTKVFRQAVTNPIIHYATKIRRGLDWESMPSREPHLKISADGSLGPNDILGYDQMLAYKRDTCAYFNMMYRAIKGYAKDTIQIGERLVAAETTRNYKCGEMFIVTDIIDNEVLLTSLTLPTKVPFAVKINPAELNKTKIDRGFHYGYCITVHKAQGSEFNKVLLMAEVSSILQWNDNEFLQRWLYTGVTRAQHELMVHFT